MQQSGSECPERRIGDPFEICEILRIVAMPRDHILLRRATKRRLSCGVTVAIRGTPYARSCSAVPFRRVRCRTQPPRGPARRDRRRSIAPPRRNACRRWSQAAELPPTSSRPRRRRSRAAWSRGCASGRRPGLVQGLMREYALSSQEGVALMCLAEALLRIPDARDARRADRRQDRRRRMARPYRPLAFAFRQRRDLGAADHRPAGRRRRRQRAWVRR